MFLIGMTSAAALGGCGYFPPEQGDAYAPWDFPGDVRDPVELAVRAAILAASPHNTQPWLFVVEGEVIDVYADLDRGLGTMDGLLREMYLGLGCAVENLAVAADHAGAAGQVELLPDPADEGHVARITLGSGAAGQGSLFASIAKRHTHRGPYADIPLDAGTLDALRAFAAAEPDVGLVVVADPVGRDRVRSGTVAATEAIIADQEMSSDSFRWFRHTAAQIAEHRDGVTLDAAGLGALTGVFGKQPINQMPERRDREIVQGLAPEFTDMLAGFTGEARAQMLFRIGMPWAETNASPRRPLDWVVTP